MGGAIAEVMTHNTSRTRIKHMKCSEVKLSYSLGFRIQLQSVSRGENKIHFVEAKTLDGQEQHIALEMPTSRTTHAKRERRERESTPAKQHQGKPKQLNLGKTDPSTLS
jgi:hypothetical protein